MDIEHPIRGSCAEFTAGLRRGAAGDGRGECVYASLAVEQDEQLDHAGPQAVACRCGPSACADSRGPQGARRVGHQSGTCCGGMIRCPIRPLMPDVRVLRRVCRLRTLGEHGDVDVLDLAVLQVNGLGDVVDRAYVIPRAASANWCSHVARDSPKCLTASGTHPGRCLVRPTNARSCRWADGLAAAEKRHLRPRRPCRLRSAVRQRRSSAPLRARLGRRRCSPCWSAPMVCRRGR